MRNAIFTFRRSVFTGALLCLIFSLSAQEKTVEVTVAGELETLLTQEEHQTVKKLIVTTAQGVQLATADFEYMNSMPALEELDLSGDMNTQTVSGFQSNKTIKTVRFPAIMRNLAANSFTGSALEGRVEFPSTLNGSGNLQNRMDNCQGITEFAFPDGNSTLKAIDGVVFSADETILVKYPVAKGGKSYTIPEGVIAMSLNALGYNSLLEEVTFSSTITMVNNEGTAVNFSNAFRECSSLKAIHVPEDNPRFFSIDGILGDKIQGSLLIFPPANRSETLIIDGGIIKTLTGQIFNEAYDLKNVIFTEGFESFNGNIFKPGDPYRYALEYVELPSTLQALGGEVFHGCMSIKQFICKATTPPELLHSSVFRSANSVNVRVGVPSASVEAYRASNWTKEGCVEKDRDNRFFVESIVPYYEIDVENGTSLLSASVSGFSIPLTANEIKGMEFVNWVSETPGIVIEDTTDPVTSFIMPEADVVIKAVYKTSDVTTIDITEINEYAANSLTTAHKIRLTGLYTDEEFTLLKAALGDNQVITSIIIEETDITDFSATEYFSAINPNCLKYVPEGVTSTLPNFVSGDTAISRIELTDAKPFDCPQGIVTNEEGVIYTRNCYIDGGWETISLPFAIDNINDFTEFRIEEFTQLKQDEEVVRFEEVSEWKANVPYIMSYNAETLGAALETQTYTFTAGNGTLVQTIESETIFTATYTGLTSATGLYLLNEHGTVFGIGGNNSFLSPFRAYLNLAGQQNAPVRFSVEHNGGNTTGMEAITPENEIYVRDGVLYIQTSCTQTITVYSIDGRKMKEQQIQEGLNAIEGLQQGIYLLNKRKVIIK